jgi:hypothetical protein
MVYDYNDLHAMMRIERHKLTWRFNISELKACIASFEQQHVPNDLYRTQVLVTGTWLLMGKNIRLIECHADEVYLIGSRYIYVRTDKHGPIRLPLYNDPAHYRLGWERFTLVVERA